MRSISVALCTCNGERHLDRQLQTLRLQAGVTEIVVVDDVSTDGTWDLLQAHAVEDDRLRLHRNATRIGPVRNFEQALRLVTNPWVALADQDDVWLPGKLAQLQAAWDGRSGLVHHATHKFRGAPPADLPSPAREGRKFAGSDVRRLLYRNTVVGHTVLMRTDLARRLMPFPRRVPHDWWLGTGAALLDRVQYVDEYLVHYRIHASNAYHAAGSRWRRLGEEHRLRLELLRVLAGWIRPDDAAAEFVGDYRHRLEAAERGRFPWPLGCFYFRHAALLFGGGRPLLPGRRVRKSLLAAFGPVFSAPTASPGRARPPEPAPLGRLFQQRAPRWCAVALLLIGGISAAGLASLWPPELPAPPPPWFGPSLPPGMPPFAVMPGRPGPPRFAPPPWPGDPPPW